MPDKTTTIAESPTQAFLRIESTCNIGGTPYKGTRYEWWFDKAAMARGDYGSGCRINCRGFAGADEAELVEMFRREAGELQGE